MLSSLLCLDLALHPAAFTLLHIGKGSLFWWIKNSHDGHRHCVVQVVTKRTNFLSRKADKWDEDFL